GIGTQYSASSTGTVAAASYAGRPVPMSSPPVASVTRRSTGPAATSDRASPTSGTCGTGRPSARAASASSASSSSSRRNETYRSARWSAPYGDPSSCQYIVMVAVNGSPASDISE